MNWIGRIYSRFASPITRVVVIGWWLLLALLPVTSMPLVVKLVRSSSVAAPSGIVLFLIVIIWLLPRILIKDVQPGFGLPRQVLPLFGLVLAALLSTTLSWFDDLPMFKGVDPLRNQFEALVTLAIGICFYLVTACLPRSEGKLTTALRIINWSGLVIILWSIAQGAAWYLDHRYPEWMRDFQDLLSVGPLYRGRATGFSLEPSWLAHQLNMLYLPIWLGFSMQRNTVHRWKLLGISFENLLLVGGTAVLLLTLSRVGFLAFGLMAAFVFVHLNVRLIGWLRKKLEQGQVDPGTITGGRLSGWLKRNRVRLISIALIAGFILIYALVLLGVLFVFSKVDPRMKGLFNFRLDAANPILEYARQLTFASRLVYWQAGWGIFNQHPLLGVGFGNAGYYFPEHLSPFAWSLVEVRDLVFRSTTLLNIKSLWVRLLAEGGVLAFSFFSTWVFLMWRSARSLMGNASGLLDSLSYAGQLVVLSLLVEGFSVDSFAFPYLWVTTGLVTAAVWIGYNHSNMSQTKQSMINDEARYE